MTKTHGFSILISAIGIGITAMIFFNAMMLFNILLDRPGGVHCGWDGSAYEHQCAERSDVILADVLWY